MSEIPVKGKGFFRVLHTADWHLGKSLHDYSRKEEHELFLEWLIHEIQARGVDLLVIAGDIFDTANPPQAVQALYYEFLSRLVQLGTCSAVIVAGNHDSPYFLEAPKTLLSYMYIEVNGVLRSKPADRLLTIPWGEDNEKEFTVAILPFLRNQDLMRGRSGQDQKTIEKELREGIRRAYSDTAEALREKGMGNGPVLATGHLTVVGCTKADSERDIHVGGLGAVNSSVFPKEFDYVALGHLHGPQFVEGDERVRYSGSPIPLSFSEEGQQKEVMLLDFDSSGLVARQSLPIPPWRKIYQLLVPWDRIHEVLDQFDPESGELKTWIEVKVVGAPRSVDAHQLVMEETESRDFDVLAVLLEDAPTEENGDSVEPLSIDVLAEPLEVFRLLMNQGGVEDEETRSNLETTFLEVVEEVEKELA